MQQLEPPDTFFVSAAIGWIELGDLQEAKDQLRQVSATVANHPEVLRIFWHIHATEQNWEKGLEVANALFALEPEAPAAWMHRAYALRRVEGGGLARALEALKPAAEKFPKEALIPFNLSCYACQMQQLDEARVWLKRAMKVGGKERIKHQALSDPDLEPLWEEIRQL